MTKWYRTLEWKYVDWCSYLLSALFIMFVFFRHTLLQWGQLRPGEGGCVQCLHAFVRTLRALCGGALVSVHKGSAPVGKKRSNSKHAQVAYYSTYASLFVSCVYCGERMMVYMQEIMLGWGNYAYCRWGVPVAIGLYNMAKSCMYLVFVARLKIVFSDSSYAYPKWVIYGLYSFVLFHFVGFMILTFVFYIGKKNDHYCRTTRPEWYFPLFVFADISLMTTVLALFFRALTKMLKNFSRNQGIGQRDKKAQADLFLLPMKYTVICSVAIISTMTALLLFFSTHVIALLPVDLALNCFCLVLMSKYWRPVYIFWCTPLLKCVAHTKWLPCGGMDEAELIEEVSKKQVFKKPPSKRTLASSNTQTMTTQS